MRRFYYVDQTLEEPAAYTGIRLFGNKAIVWKRRRGVAGMNPKVEKTDFPPSIKLGVGSFPKDRPGQTSRRRGPGLFRTLLTILVVILAVRLLLKVAGRFSRSRDRATSAPSSSTSDVMRLWLEANFADFLHKKRGSRPGTGNGFNE